MVRKVNETTIEDYDKPMATATKKRYKVASVDLIQGCPFRVDCQLDDQKYLAIKNRNPQLDTITKATKIRSNKELTRAESPLSSKARVLNDIVREASGIHSYTLVAPIQDKYQKSELLSSKSVALDPETNPVLKPYRDENNKNPVMSSFGHRPSSGGRTFNPATMKIRLSHGEVVQAGSKAKKGGNSFGLPVAMLSQLLHCPRLEQPSTDPTSFSSLAATSEASRGGGDGLRDFGDLFLPPDEMAVLTAKPSSKVSLAPLRSLQRKSSSMSASSYVSASGFGNPRRQTRPTKQIYEESIRAPRALAPMSTPVDTRKPAWDGYLVQVDRPKYEVYSLKRSAIADSQLMPLKEKLSRFATRSVSDSSALFCEEKRITDKMLAAAQNNANPSYTQAKGDANASVFRDTELEKEIHIIKRVHRESEHQRAQRVKHAEHVRVMDSIPTVEYQPEAVLKQIKRQMRAQRTSELSRTASASLEGEGDEESAVYADLTVEKALRAASRERLMYAESIYMSEGSQRSSVGTGSDMGGSRSTSSDGLSKRSRGGSRSTKTSVDEDLFHAIEATKAGDEDALFEFFMRASASASASAAGSPSKEDAYGSRESRDATALDRLHRQGSVGAVDRVEEGDEAVEEWEEAEDSADPTRSQEGAQAGHGAGEGSWKQEARVANEREYEDHGEEPGQADLEESDEYAQESYEEDEEQGYGDRDVDVDRGEEGEGGYEGGGRRVDAGDWLGDGSLADHMEGYDDDDVYTGPGLGGWEEGSGQFDA